MTEARRRSTQKRAPRRARSVAVQGTEPIVQALDSEVQLRAPMSLLVSIAIVVVLIVLAAAFSVSLLFSLPALVIAAAAGYLAGTRR